MNLLNYTKKLSEKIAYYDKLTREAKKNFNTTNPFAPRANMTIIWVENCKDGKD